MMRRFLAYTLSFLVLVVVAVSVTLLPNSTGPTIYDGDDTTTNLPSFAGSTDLIVHGRLDGLAPNNNGEKDTLQFASLQVDEVVWSIADGVPAAALPYQVPPVAAGDEIDVFTWIGGEGRERTALPAVPVLQRPGGPP